MLTESGGFLKERDALFKLHQIHRAMSTEQAMDRLLQMIMDHAIAFTRAERGFLILRDEETGKLDVRVARNIGKEVIDHPMFKVSRGIIDKTWQSNQPLILDSAKDDAEFKSRKTVQNLQLASVACLPLKWKGNTVGVIYLDNRFRTGLFAPGDLVLLELFADGAASALGNAKLFNDLERKKQELELANSQLRHENVRLQEQLFAAARKIKDLEATTGLPKEEGLA